MRRSKEEAARTRSQAVQAAARLLRERGLQGVSVAEIMGAIGMTQGGFYRHFESREALLAEALALASAETSEQLGRASVAAEPEGAWGALVERYLSPRHLAHPESGCPVAALASEAARESPAAREAFTAALRQLVGTFERAAPVHGPAARERAVASAATAVGAVVLARASSDPALASEILEAARHALGAGAPAGRPSGRRPR